MKYFNIKNNGLIVNKLLESEDFRLEPHSPVGYDCDYEQGVYFGRYGAHNEYVEKDEPYCMATRELESCNCAGDRSKCNFYMNMDKKDEKERD